MSTYQERILVVEGDPGVSDLIARQTLEPLGFQVKVIRNAPGALQEAVSFIPDIMIVNLNLPGLSGKDLLVALSSQGLSIPVIVIADQGMEWDVIQAFRLGASDYIKWPVRETEVVSAVERSLIQVRANRDRERLSRKVDKTNRELQNRVRELTTILGIGKVVTSITDHRTLFDKLIEGAVFVAEADKGWLLIREAISKPFKLRAQRNLPPSIAEKIDHPWDDGISSLVARSGGSISLHGPTLKRLRISRMGNSALVVPVKVKKEIVGMVVVVREEPKPFSHANRTLLEALANYASISMINVILIQTVQDRARTLDEEAEASHESESVKSAIFRKINEELETPLSMISHEVGVFAHDQKHTLSNQQMGSLRLINEQLHRAMTAVEGLNLLQKVQTPKNFVTVNLVDLARLAISRFQKYADNKNIRFDLEIIQGQLFVMADVDQIRQVFDIILSNALRMSSNGRVVLGVSEDIVGNPHISIKDSGPGISEEDQARIFLPFNKFEHSGPEGLDHLGIGLALAKEIIQAHGGQIWVVSRLGAGSIFHFKLKPAK
jgi:signal transduction histidine kinase/FixJ family two-component response regulator